MLTQRRGAFLRFAGLCHDGGGGHSRAQGAEELASGQGGVVASLGHIMVLPVVALLVKN
jgi:hypothetical protein